jgi:hypothetical protein
MNALRDASPAEFRVRLPIRSRRSAQSLAFLDYDDLEAAIEEDADHLTPGQQN